MYECAQQVSALTAKWALHVYLLPLRHVSHVVLKMSFKMCFKMSAQLQTFHLLAAAKEVLNLHVKNKNVVRP